jgi:hypothetical protein
MATPTTPQPVQPINRLSQALRDLREYKLRFGDLAHPVNRLLEPVRPRAKQVSGAAPPQREAKPPRAHSESDLAKALLELLIETALVLVALCLWPVVFGAVILLLVVLAPFVAVAVGVRAIFSKVSHFRHPAGPRAPLPSCCHAESSGQVPERTARAQELSEGARKLA